MYRFTGFLLLALASSAALSAPFIVSDPLDSRATHCGFQVDDAARKDVPVATTGTTNTSKICRYDAASLTDGPHTITATAVAIDPTWGRLESAPSAPFALTKPASPGVPTGFKLVP
jgi:hypothetical protein